MADHKTVAQILGDAGGARLSPAASNLTVSDLRSLQTAFAQYDANRAGDAAKAACCCCCTAVSSITPAA